MDAARRRKWWRLTRRMFREWVGRAWNTDMVFLLFVAAVVGLLAGGAAIVFGGAIHWVQRALWGVVEPSLELLRETAWWKVVLWPTVGGLAVGLVTTFGVKEAKGHGVPEVIRAVALNGARIRGRVAVAKTVASALTIGSGGSAGREGPVIQIGAAIGSRVGQLLQMSRRRLRTLVGCGAAAGIAATFNAPMAGALFAVEVVLGEFGAAQFGPIVIASVLATTVARWWRGAAPVFVLPLCGVVSVVELVPYVVLGVLCGVVSWLYIRTNAALAKGCERAGPESWRKSRWASVLRPALGGTMVGAVAIFAPQIMGDGHGLTNSAFLGEFGVPMMLGLALLKVFTTGVTLGSGGSGGVFSPAIAIGALLGAATGQVAGPLLGARFGGVAAYSVAGMGGMVAGSMLAPMTAILMVFEITNNYAIILPVIVVAIVADVMVAKLTRGLSIYTGPLVREGVKLFRNASPDLLRNCYVRDHLRPATEQMSPAEPAARVADRILWSEASQFYVTDEDAHLIGVMALPDVRRLLRARPPLLTMLLADDVMRRDIPVAYADETLSAVLAKFAKTSPLLPELPVLRGPEDQRLLGVIAYADVLSVYQAEIFRADAVPALVAGLSEFTERCVDVAPGYQVAERSAPTLWHGRTLRELALPATRGVQVLLLKRPGLGGRPLTFVPDAHTALVPRDRVVILGPAAAISAIMETP